MSEAIAVPLSDVGWLTSNRDPLETAVLSWLAKYREPTFTCYRRDIKIFIDWCEDAGLPPLETKRVHLELYIRWMQERGWAEATVNSRFCTVASFFKCCLRDEVIVKDPSAFVDRPKIDKDAQKRPAMSPLVHGIFMDAAEKVGVMEHALLALLSMRGLRIAEACSLDVTDVVHHDGYDHVRGIGKNRKRFDLPLPVPCARAVRAAVDDRDLGPLLLTQWRTRMTRNAAQRCINRVAEYAHLDVKVTPHSFRRAYIMSMLAGGVDLRDAQLAARHSSSATTEIYDVRAKTADRDASHRLSGFLAGMKG